MKSAEIKTSIQKLISNVEDENFLHDLYSILNNYAISEKSKMTDFQKMEIDKRLKAHQDGESINLTLEQVKKSALLKIRK